MLKKLLAVLLSVAMLTGLVTVPAFADATVVTTDFTGLTIDEANKGGWPSVSNLITICGGYTNTGVGGKDITDTSVITGTYLLVKKAFSGVSVLEYNMLRTETGGTTRVEKDPYGGDLGLPTFRYSAQMYPSGRTYQAGKWYHLAYEMNIDDETVADPAVGKYNYYVNGVKIGSGNVPAGIKDGSIKQFRLANTSATEVYYDDFKFTTGAKYDTASASASITAVAGGAVNESAKTITIRKVNVNDVASMITTSAGATVTGVVDPDTFMTKTEGTVEEGDLIAVCAADGATYTYYTAGSNVQVVSDNFNSLSIAEANKDGWPSVSSLITICGGYTKTGIGGKATTDTSVITSSYLLVKKAFSGVSVLEYNMLRTETGGTTRVEKDPYGGDLGLPTFRYSAQMYPSGRTYQAGKWYHLAYEMNIDDATISDPAVGKYNYYVDGVKIGSGNVPAGIMDGSVKQFRLANTSVTEVYYDDIKFTTGDVYNVSKATGTIASSTGVAFDNEYKTISAKNMTVADCIAALTPSEGCVVTGIVDPENIYTKSGTEKVNEGDFVAVLAPDGVSYTYYKVTGNVVNSYINDDFTGLAGTRVSDYVNGKGQAEAAGMDITRNGLSFNEEKGEGAFYEIVENDGDEVLMLYANNYDSTPFFGRNLGPGTTSANAVEFSIMKPDKKSPSKIFFYGPNESTKDTERNWELINAYAVAFETDQYVYFNNEKVFTYKLNEWYRVAIVTDIPGNKMTLYVNGVKAAEKVFDDPIVNIYDVRFAGLKGTSESIVYYDDIKWYDYNAGAGFDDSEKIATLTSASSAVTIETGAAYGTINTTLTTVADLVAAVSSTGTIKAYDATGAEIADASAALYNGTYLEVTSIDGLAKAKYTYVADSISGVYFNVEGTEAVNGTITAKIHVVNSDETAPVTGRLFAAKYEGNKLVEVNFAVVNASCAKGSYIDNVYSASVEVTDSATQNVKAFFWAEDGVKPIADSAELTVSSTNF